MPVAICIKAANSTARHIHELWTLAGRFEDEPSMAAIGYPPHMTLAIYDDLIPEDLEPAFDAAFRDAPPLRITFNRIRYFESTPLILWAAPAASQGLDLAHAIVHDLIDPAHCRPHYRPGAWVPHCGLALQVSEGRRAEALAFADSAIAPFDLLFDTADCIDFFPITVVRERTLASIG